MPVVRVGRRGGDPGRGVARDGRLTPATENLLRPALEAAVVVARMTGDDAPVVSAPVPLRPFLRFSRLPPRALGIVRKALDADEPFRLAVAEKASEDMVGRASWLFLHRPEGWSDELGDLAAAAESAGSEAAAARAESDALRAARRQLAAAQGEAGRWRDQAAESRAEAARAVAVLGEERRNRREAVERTIQLDRDLAAARLEREQALAVAQSERAGAALAAEAVSRASREAASLRAELAATAAGNAVSGAVAALEAAASAVISIGESLLAAARDLDVVPSGLRPRQPGEDLPAADGGTARSRSARRRPAPLPGGVLDDSVEAADHLLRLPGVLALVDGYNVTHAAWPDLALAEQRRRLVDALGELAARSGAEVLVVFDGAEVPSQPVVSSAQRTVKVSFSPAGVEADDVVIDMASSAPQARPVVVVSSDRRVRDGAAGAGANTLSSSTLLAAIGRQGVPRS
ncbi:MAG: NYN domain-containing protein [Acidimicrobiales bacterium]